MIVRDRVLFVCTANECRSPFAAALMARMAGGAPVDVSSAGLEATRRRVPQEGVALAARFGLDTAAHLSAPVDADRLADDDLVLALARRHARELVQLVPGIAPRVFTLKQFARWIAEHPRPPRSLLGSWLDAAAADRPRTLLLGDDPDDDVPDPVGQPMPAWERMAAHIEPAVRATVAGLYGPRRRHSV